MKLNEDTVLESSVTPAILVPYKHIHVPRYHKWMQSTQLLELTASERLTIEQEYANMKSWREDENKMTFIVMDGSNGTNYMAGDVNLYMLGDNENGQAVAEVEVMIAEHASRRKGLAKDALIMLMAYAIKHLTIHTFVAKILEHNAPSIHLFSQSLPFEEERRVQAFNEIHFKLDVDEELQLKLEDTQRSWHQHSYTNSSFSTNAIQNETYNINPGD